MTKIRPRSLDLLNCPGAITRLAGDRHPGPLRQASTRRRLPAVDAFFRPPEKVREAATRTAIKAGMDAHWLNDAVKRFMSAQGEFAPFLELDHLRVMTARPEYLLAMKCLAMRIGAEFHDEEDIRFLLRLLDVRSREHALRIITKYYPLERFPQKTLYALEDLLPQSPA